MSSDFGDALFLRTGASLTWTRWSAPDTPSVGSMGGGVFALDLFRGAGSRGLLTGDIGPVGIAGGLPGTDVGASSSSVLGIGFTAATGLGTVFALPRVVRFQIGSEAPC